MNHPSEWARYFDEKTGSYRYKHKGSGVIRDTFMNIGKVFKNNENDVAKKTAEKVTKTIAEKVGQRVEKGSKQIRKILQELKKSDTVEKGSKQMRKKRKPLSEDSKKKLANVLTKHKKILDAFL